MSQLELESRFVKRGYWVNLSNGPIMGQTITTDSRTGAVIVALLAVITSLGMTHLWHILTFSFHQLRATGRPSDGLFRHQQALLRTLPTPSFLMADSIKLWMVWRGVSKHALVRSSIHLSTALLFSMVSLAVSIFSSSIISSSNIEVLVHSPYCGTLNSTAKNWESYTMASWLVADSYGPACYNTTNLQSQCNLLPRPNIPFTAELAPCPFGERMCATPGFSLDSGLLDLNEAFGLNLQDADRVRYRRKVTCAVLSLDGFTSIANATSKDAEVFSRPLFPGEQFIHYLYGTYKTGAVITHSLVTANTSVRYTQVTARNYMVLLSRYVVIPELQRKDADVVLRMTAKNSMKFMNPVDDPMFSAHRSVSVVMSKGNNTFYLSDFPGSVMGCAQQYQYCINQNSCSELRGIFDHEAEGSFPNANEIQSKILELLRNLAFIHDMTSSPNYDAEKFVNVGSGFTESLPDDQWIQELKAWNSVAWAGHQIAIADYAIGPTVRDPQSKSYVLPPSNEAEKKLCGMQKLRKPGGFVNINFFGLVFTIVISSTFVLIDLVLVRSLLNLRKYITRLAPRLERWLQDGIYQLHRRAYEAQGNGVWKRITEEVPITADDCLLPDLLIETFPNPGTPMSQAQSLHEQLSKGPAVQHQTGSSISEFQPQEPGQRTRLDHQSGTHFNGRTTPRSPSVTTEAELHQPERTSFEILHLDSLPDQTTTQPGSQRLPDA